jgi:flagella basal body P-ring formation protein FlgA
MQRVPRTRLSADAITDPDQAIGLAARNAITANRPIAVSELMKPEIVQRGASVTIVYQVPGVMLAVRGKASEGGAEGDMIDVVNVQSNRTLRATVVGPGQVTVTSMAARLLASAEQIENPVRSQPVSGAK